MNKTAYIHTRVEPRIKEKAEKIVSKLGLNLSSVMRLLLHRISSEGTIPIELKTPSKKTLEALNEPTKDLPRFKSAKALFKELSE